MTIGDVISSTLHEQSADVADEVLGHHPLTMILKKKGKIEEFTGGYEIRKAVLYNTTAVGGFYAGNESFNMNASDDLATFVYAIKQCYEPMIISGRDMRANKGSARIVDLVDQKFKATKARLKNTFSSSILGDGTGFGGRGFDGIQKHVSSTPTVGTLGGIDRAVYSFAQNVATTGTTFTAANIQSALTNLILQVTRGTEMPDVGLAGRTAYKFLHDSLTAIQRLGSENTARGGYKALYYDGVEWFFDGGFGGSTLSLNTVRILNTDYLSFDVESQANFKPLETKPARPFDQDTYANVIIVEGNLCSSAPQLMAYGD
jgi:hypothetical protein